MARSVWIDCDMGFDDLAAVLTVAASADWTIAGLSLVAGNAPLDVVIDNSERAAACFDWRFPLHAGCASPLKGLLVTAQKVLGPDALRTAGRSLPKERRPIDSGDAVEALARWIDGESMPTVLALGPLTNLARLVERYPAAAKRISCLMWMGGSAGPGNHTAVAEFNAYADPESVQAVLDAGLPLAMVGLDACRQFCVQRTDAEALRGSGTARAAILADLLEGYVRIGSPDGSRPMAFYDPAAAVALVSGDAVEFRAAQVMMELEGRHTRGMTVVEWRVPQRAQANARVATRIDAVRARAIVLSALRAAAGDQAAGPDPERATPVIRTSD